MQQPAWRVVLFCAGFADCPWSDQFLCRITALMGSVVAGAGVNPADQRWGFWPLLPLSSWLLEELRRACP
ncbi:hypothetical protein WH7805_01717 [Synechococcus sp. WH 7805]|jgi:hypothetical protein|nr:hypothetical protein [Synechococcus sp. WH 7805]EAR18512.1 hypothetical protein WH7805_01717 [Synechococcus sp. WH 7805]